jgi:transcriptional regulator GlxA family with amidase domain
MPAVEKTEMNGTNAASKARLDLETLRELAPACGFEVRQLAVRLGLSRRQLERLFSTQLASTPDSWLREERLQCARQMLLSVPRVKAVAYALGFRQPSQFARDFKARFGITPSSVISPRHEYVSDDLAFETKPRSNGAGV